VLPQLLLPISDSYAGRPSGRNRSEWTGTPLITLKVCEAFAEDNHALGSDFILANILGMIPAGNLITTMILRSWTSMDTIAKPDDVVSEERN